MALNAQSSMLNARVGGREYAICNLQSVIWVLLEAEANAKWHTSTE